MCDAHADILLLSVEVSCVFEVIKEFSQVTDFYQHPPCVLVACILSFTLEKLGQLVTGGVIWGFSKGKHVYMEMYDIYLKLGLQTQGKLELFGT